MKILKTAEVAHFLGIHEQTVRRLTKRGKLPARKLGKMYIYIQEEIQDYIQDSREDKND